MKVEMNWDFPDWAGRFKKHLAKIYLAVAASAQTNRAELFYSEGKNNGRSGWAPLKFRDGMILQKRGILRKSITGNQKGQAGDNGIVRFQPDEVIIGTKLFYAAMMNWGTTKLPGGVLKGKNSPRKVLKIPVPQGDKAGPAAKEINAQQIDKKIFKLTEKASKTKNGNAAAKYRKQINKLIEKKSQGKGGDGFIFRKSVKIPARRFDDWNTEDQAEMAETLRNAIGMVLNGKA